jgi:predicted ribosome quality control (RQC) complex YloA/Tae2 family protein
MKFQKGRIIIAAIIALGFFSFSAVAAEKTKEEIQWEKIMKIQQMKNNEKKIQKKIDRLEASITEKLSAKKITDDDFSAVEKMQKTKEKYQKQLRMLRSEKKKLESEGKNRTVAWMEKWRNDMKKKREEIEKELKKK